MNGYDRAREILKNVEMNNFWKTVSTILLRQLFALDES